MSRWESRIISMGENFQYQYIIPVDEHENPKNNNERVETMTQNLPQIFNYQGNQVRIVEINGEPYFVAKDVCEVLEIKNHKDAVSRLKESMKSGVVITDPHGRPQMTKVISEAGLYKLIFQSRKPEAEKFSDWVAEEVLPAIRKTGSYIVPKVSQAELMHMMTSELVRQEKALAEVKTEVKEVQSEVTDLKTDINDEFNTIHERIDSWDKLSIQRDKRQMLVAMVGKYANEVGVSYGEAWKDFKQAFNTAFKTNLDLRITWFMRGNSPAKRPTMPEYLEKTGWIEDGLRVADKMLSEVRRRCS